MLYTLNMISSALCRLDDSDYIESHGLLSSLYEHAKCITNCL